MRVDVLDAFRASRGLSLIAGAKELELLRQFFKFCLVRHWVRENPAAQIKGPRNIQPNEVEPYTPAEVESMIIACDRFGRSDYERLRARAMVLTMRYTGLRIGDVAMLAKERISRDGGRWRVFLHTEKTGKPVFLPIPDELRLALNAVPVPRGGTPDCRYFFLERSNLRTSSERNCGEDPGRRLQGVQSRARACSPFPAYARYGATWGRRQFRRSGRHSGQQPGDRAQALREMVNRPAGAD